MRRLLCSAAIVAAAAASIAGCGTKATTGAAHLKPASLVLDYTPNAIHSGIYEAMAKGYLIKAGVDLHVVVPGQTTDAISLLLDHKVDFAILDIHDLAIADALNKHLVAIMGIVQRPLASVIAQPKFSKPSQLAGQTIGVTGDPSDTAVLNSVLAGSGLKPSAVKTLQIGFNAVPDLIAGRVAAATAFWNDEGVQLTDTHKGFHIFRVENFGAPPYPELVLTATSAELNAHPALAKAVVGAFVRGYIAAEANPASAVKALTSQVAGLNASAVAEQLKGEIPAFKAPDYAPAGSLVFGVLRQWAQWEVQFGIVKTQPDVGADFSDAYLPAS